ncbi:MAG: hypothetical protein L0H53_06720 [Candidatus Nitrosocosmicus sp.]|nr:hypothetical protein [Candidatus Nitrosocosmicus sp.]MDN5869014.1 hypothetical protein [Candidatus Nitrosocosmicus sp.]
MVDSQSSINNTNYCDDKQYKRCAGVNCCELGKNCLRIIYLKKEAGFCDSCAKDLLNLKLVEKID